ncbi:hypothetical protein [Flavobacterium polysaccharolyticum]|uniref:Uncharacterized protein n=1 Tax=Flavobacterium polysaccharolyticum TaxID=3133148 RepID=A0ABU9NP21_9FLAO
MSEEKLPREIEITLPTAQEWVRKYKDRDVESVLRAKRIDAFLIPLDALQKVMSQKIDAVRAYKGINPAGELTLMLVGTVLNTETGVYEDVFQNENPLSGSADTEIVFDGVRTCPPYEDPNSPMNK